MFASKQRGTVIASGLKIVGSVTAEGLVEVHGQIEGELHCSSLIIAPGPALPEWSPPDKLLWTARWMVRSEGVTFS